jgi:hypothetical protein
MSNYANNDQQSKDILQTFQTHICTNTCSEIKNKNKIKNNNTILQRSNIISNQYKEKDINHLSTKKGKTQCNNNINTR